MASVSFMRKRSKPFDAEEAKDQKMRHSLLERDNKRARHDFLAPFLGHDKLRTSRASISGAKLQDIMGAGSQWEGGEIRDMLSRLREKEESVSTTAVSVGDGVDFEIMDRDVRKEEATTEKCTLGGRRAAIPATDDGDGESRSLKGKKRIREAKNQTPRVKGDAGMAMVIDNKERAMKRKKMSILVDDERAKKREREEKVKLSPGTQLEKHLKDRAHWRDRYIKAFREDFLLYLDGLDKETEVHVHAALKILEGRTTPFFSNDVTHFVVPAGTEKDRSKILNNVDKNRTSGLFKDKDRETPRKDKRSFHHSKATAVTKFSLRDKAEQLGMRIWGMEKLETVMCHILYPQNPTLGLQKILTLQSRVTTPASLPTLLQTEAQTGRTFERDLTSRDPNWREVHPKNIYLIVEDATGIHRPIVIAEYQKPKKGSGEQPDWPVFWKGCPEGKTPFGGKEDGVKKEDKVIQKRRNAVAQDRQERRQILRANDGIIDSEEEEEEEEEQEEERDVVEPPKKMTLNQRLMALADKPKNPNLRRCVSLANLHRSVTSTSTSTNASIAANMNIDTTTGITKITDMPPPPLPIRRASQEDEDIGVIPPPLERRNHALPGNPLHVKDRDGVFLASGNSVHLSTIAGSTTSVLTGSAAEEMKKGLIDPRVLALRKREVELGVGAGEGKLKRAVSIDAALNAKKGGLMKKVLAPRERKRKEGYCENCRGKYEDFDAHVVSTRHMKIANRDSYWKDVDDIIRIVQRPLF